MNKLVFPILAVIVVPVITGATARGQETARPGAAADARAVSPEDLDLFRKDVRSLKKQIVALNMNLTDDEAVKFWPVYDKYAADLTTLYERKYALLQSYAANYSTLTGEQADKYITGRADVEDAVVKSGRATWHVFNPERPDQHRTPQFC